jgi:hypothetical protein
VEVRLADTVIEDTDLNVQNGYVGLRAPNHRLTLKLDRPARDGEPQAKWNGAERKLTIKVPLIQTGINFT